MVAWWLAEGKACELFLFNTTCRQKKRKKTETGLKRCTQATMMEVYGGVVVVMASNTSQQGQLATASTSSSAAAAHMIFRDHRQRVVVATLSNCFCKIVTSATAATAYFVVSFLRDCLGCCCLFTRFFFCYQKCIQTAPNGRLVVVVFFLFRCRIPIYFP